MKCGQKSLLHLKRFSRPKVTFGFAGNARRYVGKILDRRNTMRCIYCARDDSIVDFNREHIIPQSIGGKFFLDGLICADCNSILGDSVDTEILKLSETIEALDALKLPYNKKWIIKKYYQVKCIFNNIKLKAILKDNRFFITDQKLPDGSMFVENQNTESIIRKLVQKDKRLKGIGLSEKFINENIDELLSTHLKSKPGAVIIWPNLGLRLIKHNGYPKFSVESNSDQNINRLIAKIVFETFFFICASKWAENINFLEPLYNLIVTGASQDSIYITRIGSDYDEYKPYHAIMIENVSGNTHVRITFFGKIVFLLIGPLITDTIYTDLENHTNITGIKCILFEQDLVPSKKKIGVILNDGTIKGIWHSK